MAKLTPKQADLLAILKNGTTLCYSGSILSRHYFLTPGYKSVLMSTVNAIIKAGYVSEKKTGYNDREYTINDAGQQALANYTPAAEKPKNTVTLYVVVEGRDGPPHVEAVTAEVKEKTVSVKDAWRYGLDVREPKDSNRINLTAKEAVDKYVELERYRYRQAKEAHERATARLAAAEKLLATQEQEQQA